MSLLSVRHQPDAHAMLQRGLRGGRAPHAYIFYGPDGVGKRTMALGLARLQMCEAPVEAQAAPPEYLDSAGWRDGCGRCRACELCDGDAHPDVHVVHRQLIRYHDDQRVRGRKGVDLGVDVIRQFLIAPAARKSMCGGPKVFIVDEAERLSIQAQNALLKTLEEPPPDTTIVLLARGLDTMLPTTRSRCHIVRFGPLPIDFVQATLQERCADLDDDGAWFAARHEPGSLGRALDIVEGGYLATNQEVVSALLQFKRTRTLATAKAFQGHAEELGKAIKSQNPDIDVTDATRQALRAVLGLVASVYRDVLNLACRERPEICNRAHAADLARWAERCGPGTARESIGAVAEAEAQLGFNANVLLVLEGLCIELARLDSPAAVGGGATIR